MPNTHTICQNGMNQKETLNTKTYAGRENISVSFDKSQNFKGSPNNYVYMVAKGKGEHDIMDA